MKKNRTQQLVIIFICIILMVSTFVMKLTSKENSEVQKKATTEQSSYLDEEQFESMDDTLYDENASDN